jgi:hypothetical protein
MAGGGAGASAARVSLATAWRPADRRTIEAATTVRTTKIANPTIHQPVWSGRSRFGSTSVGYASSPTRLPAFEAANRR